MTRPSARRHARLSLLGVALAVFAGSTTASSDTAEAAVVHEIAFPLAPGSTYRYTSDFGAPRAGHTHQGNDILAAKLVKIVAAQSGVVTAARVGSSPTAGNYLVITGDDGWRSWYIHINNDTPGTDDGANPAEWRFAPGIAQGVRVRAGQFIAYVGDSGNAESTAPHLHFELHDASDVAVDPYPSLQAAEARLKAAVPAVQRWAQRPVRPAVR